MSANVRDDDEETLEFADESEWMDEDCEHVCEEYCYDDQGFRFCEHSHCISCGGCGCPGYCDDHQSYNLPPDPLDSAVPL